MFFIIGFFVACGATIALAVTAYIYYHKNQDLNQAMAELAQFQALLAQSEQLVRGAANNLAQEVAENADGLREQAQLQQTHINQDVNQLDRQVNAVSHTATRLDATAIELNHLSHAAETDMATLTAELNQVKADMIMLNAQLKLTQEALVEKEKSLNETVIQLQATQHHLNETTQTCSGIVNGVSSQLHDAQSLLPSNALIVSQQADIERLFTENVSMSTSIKRLESTVIQLTDNFRTLTQTNRTQLAEINTLVNENIQLQQVITALTNALENQTSAISSHQQHSGVRGLRIFEN